MENYSENAKGEQQKQQDEARAQALCSLADRVHGKDPQTGAMSGGKSGDSSYGKVTIWHVHDKKYVTVQPVDGAEMLSNGSAVLDKPS